MNTKYTYTWNKTGKTYDFTSVVQLTKEKATVLQKINEIVNILGNECSRAEAREIAGIIERKFRPLPNTQQQPTPPPVPTCPRCGSTAITAGARGVNGFWGFIGASKTVNRCANCGNTWTPRG